MTTRGVPVHDGADDGRETDEVDVVVVGAGPAGLSAALGLGHLGLRTVLVEKHPTTSDHPRATLVNGRTLEILRGWGVADEIISAGLPEHRNRGVAFLTRMARPEFGAIVTRGASPALDAEVDTYGPYFKTSCPQDVVEPVLLRAARARPGVEIRFGTTARGLHEYADGVQVDLTSAAGDSSRIRARYVIAADGATSAVRSWLGVRMDGPARLGAQMGVYFHADLGRHVADRPYLLWWIYNAETSGVLITLDGRHRWTYNLAYDPAVSEPGDFDRARCVELVRAAVGDPDLDVDVRSARPWSMQARVAERMRVGRVFLVGDAAHPLPPTGGQGMNTGVADVHNLVWKLAAVCSGGAGDALLDTYEQERRPVAQVNVTQSLANAERMARAGLGGILENDAGFVDRVESFDEDALAPVRAAIADQREHFEYWGQIFGVSYESDGVVPDGSEPVRSPVGRYRPHGRPGARAPHLWLDPEHTRSTVDLLSPGRLVLLTTAAGGRLWSAPADVDVVTLGPGGAYPEIQGDFTATYGLGVDGAVMVRPDGHVAWRSRTFDSSTVLADVVARALCTPAHPSR